MLADRMIVETIARGTKTKLAVSKEDIIQASKDQADSDLEKIDLPMEVSAVAESEHGTTISLDLFNQKLSLPTPERLRELLMLEYGTSDNFRVFVNGVKLDMEDIAGKLFQVEHTIADAGGVRLRIKISDGSKPLKQAGILFRIQGKVVGQAGWYGLDDDEEIPPKLLKKVRVEVEADDLADAMTADWGALIESNRGFEQALGWVKQEIKARLWEAHQNDMQLAQARLKRKINEALTRLPEYRRQSAQRALEKILSKFYDEKEDRQDAIISVVLDAFERDEYWIVIEKINAARDRDVEDFASALSEFGLLQLAIMAQQATQRLRMLDEIDLLILEPKTLEKDVHKALEDNRWIFGPIYTRMSSNQTLKSVIETYTQKEFVGMRAKKRPDLLLMVNFEERYLLVEFKRPSHALTRDDEAQAAKYRDDLSRKFHNKRIDIMVIGGSVSADISPQYGANNTQLLSYAQIVSKARAELEWLLENRGK